MSKDNNIPLCYQITVSNITKIGDRVMSDFYVIFKSAQKNQNSWQSPLIHGKLTKDNTNFPWNFIVDNPKLTVEFCEPDDKNKKGFVVGSTPLLLMKKEGEEQFLIFGCNEQNRGRKVAQVQFSYCQCSLARSSISDQNKKISAQKSGSDYNRRIELQFSSDATVDKQVKQQPLKVIPEQQQYIQEQTLREEQFNNGNYQTIYPSQLETLQYTYRNQKSLSYNDLEMLKEMEDTTDKWYRSNFGKNRPTNLEYIDFQHQTTDIKVKYEPNFRKLNGSQMITHIQLQNILANMDKRPKSIEFYGVQLEKEKMKKTKIVTVQCGKSFNKDWKMLIRLPVESKNYGLQIITDDSQKLYCMIVNDGHYDKNKVDVYDQVGEMVGSLLYNLKLIKNMQVQTLDIVVQQPVVQNQNQKYQSTINQQLNKSFIKQVDRLTNITLEKSNKLKKESYLISKLEEKTHHQSLKLQNQPYFQKYKHQVDLQSPKATKKNDYNIPSQKKNKLTPKSKIYEAQSNILNYMNNQPYIGRTPQVKSSFRKNQYELIDVKNQSPDFTHQEDASSIIEVQAHKALSEQNNRTKVSQKMDKFQFPSEKNMRKSQGKQKHRQQAVNNFEKIQLKNKDLIKIEAAQPKRSQLTNQDQESNKNSLKTKIEAIKKIGINLQKYARPLSPYSSYKDQNISRNENEFESRKIQYPTYQDEQRPKVAHKKTYREPINVTPYFTSSSNLKFSKHFHIKTENRQTVEQNSPLKNKLKASDKTKVKNLLKSANLDQFQKSLEKNKNNPKYQQQSLQKQLGVNTDRIALVKNVLQTSYKPQIYTQKKDNQDQKQKNNFTQDPKIYKQEVRSNFDSLINENDNQNHYTKYSSQTIQPVTNQVHLDFFIITISVQVFQNMFGIKYLRVFVPNKYHYQTQRIKNTSNLVWQCNGFFFNRITPNQNLYIELLSQSTNNLVKIGKAKVSAVQFKHSKKQGVIRSYLIRQDEVVGELLLTFKNTAKNSNQLIDDQFLNKKRNHTTHQRKSEENQQKSTQKNKTPAKQSKSLKKSKSKGKKKSESITQILKNKKKEQTIRYMMNESSRANIDSRVNPIRQKKFEGGRNIIIGRHSRFPTSEEEEYHKNVPGPGAYDVKTEFRKYN